MIKSLGIRIGVLLVLLTLTFSAVALADDGNTFRLVLEDTTTGVQRVITDNVSLGTLNANGDKNGTLGTIGFNSSVGNFFVTINATSSEAADGGGILTLSANVAYQSTGTEQFAVVLEDVYGADTDGATLENTIGGYNSTSNTVTSMAVLSSSASLSVQSWLDPTGAVPVGSTIKNSGPEAISVNAANIATSGAYNNNLAPIDATSGSYDKAVTTSGATASIYSEAVVQFTNSTAGSVNFTLTADEIPNSGSSPVPEPTSLMLLGSALLGLGVFRSRKRS